MIHRYILGQLLLYGVMAIGVFVFLFLAGSAIRDVMELVAGGRISLGLFFKILFMLVPYLLAYALPLGLLMAILLVLGRLSAQREITAMKAAGMSLWHIAAPIIFLAVMGTVASVLVNLYYKPIARRSYRDMIENVVRNDPLRFIQEGSFIKEFPGYLIYVGEKSGNELRDFWIWELDKDLRASVLLRAKRGEFLYDDDGLRLNLYEGTAEARNQKDVEDMQDASMPMVMFKESSVKLPWEQIMTKKESVTKLSRLTFPELLVKRSELKQDKSPEAKIQRVKVQVQIQQNFVNAFGVLALALIGIPLGIKSSRKETFVNLALALIVVLSYYGSVTLINCLNAKPYLRPDLLIWLPNLIFTGLGLYWIRRVNQH